MKKTLLGIIAFFCILISGYAKDPVTLKIGHVGHDHHLVPQLANKPPKTRGG